MLVWPALAVRGPEASSRSFTRATMESCLIATPWKVFGLFVRLAPTAISFG